MNGYVLVFTLLLTGYQPLHLPVIFDMLERLPLSFGQKKAKSECSGTARIFEKSVAIVPDLS
jgi:hypothetical protein